MNIFTDGSTLNNQDPQKRIGGIGVYFGDNDPRNVSVPIIKNATNQRAELKACIEALKKPDLNKYINIYTDSKYVIGCMTEWVDSWKSNDWKKKDGSEIKNLKLIKQLYELTQKFKKVNFNHVKAHQKKPSKSEDIEIWHGNMMADKLATNAAKSIDSNLVIKEEPKEDKLNITLSENKKSQDINKIFNEIKVIKKDILTLYELVSNNTCN